MGLSFRDRVKETTTTTGTGTVTLGGAVSGFRTFQSIFTVGDWVRYAIVLSTEWEVGEGILATTTTLSRINVFASSNAGALVNFSAGSKEVWCDLPADTIADIGLTLAFFNRGVPQ